MTDQAPPEEVAVNPPPQSSFPINRVVAFAGPYIAIGSGALADWLLVHVHLLGIFHTTKSSISSMLTQGLVFALTSLLVWAGHQKWLTGWQKFESAAAPEFVNGPDMGMPEDLGDYDPSTAGGESPAGVPESGVASPPASGSAPSTLSPPPPPRRRPARGAGG